MQLIKSLPLLVVVVAAYNLAVVMAGAAIEAELARFGLLSGAVWVVTTGDLLLGVGLVLVCVELVKATRTSTAAIVDHVLSLGLFVICLIEFIALPAAGTGVFFLITLMCLIDVVAGFTVTIVAARRDIGIDRGMRLEE
jgi:hypothetical protein